MLARLRDEDELAALLAHEINHVAGHHGILEHRATKRMITSMVLGGLGGWGSVISIGLQTSVYGFSRDLEQEADDRAWKSCAPAGTTRTRCRRSSTSSAKTTRVSIRAHRRSGARIPRFAHEPRRAARSWRAAASRAPRGGVRTRRVRPARDDDPETTCRTTTRTRPSRWRSRWRALPGRPAPAPPGRRRLARDGRKRRLDPARLTNSDKTAEPPRARAQDALAAPRGAAPHRGGARAYAANSRARSNLSARARDGSRVRRRVRGLGRGVRAAERDREAAEAY